MFEKTPLLYTDREGTYECQVTSAGVQWCSGLIVCSFFSFFHPSTGYKQSFIHNH